MVIINKGHRPAEVILLYPKTSVDFGPAIAPPFSVLTIAAPLENQGINVRIIDQRVDHKWRTHLQEALRDRPVCCGISAMTGKQILFGIQAAKVIRDETDGSIPIVWGGVHPSLLPEQTLRSPYVDIVCVGEGEQTLLDLVNALKENRALSQVKGIAFFEGDRLIFTGERNLINIEQLLPTPWELVDVESYIKPDLYLRESSRVLDIGQSSRGCPHSCTFCYNSAVRQRKWRAMSVEKTLNMIVQNVNRFNLDGIWLRDDEFFLDMNRVAEVCRGIISNGLNISWYTSGARVTDILKASDEQLRLLKQSGAYVLRFGAESGSDRVLEFIKKGQTVKQILEVNRRCKAFGFKPVYSLMFGIPTETFSEINETLSLFFRLKEENPDASLAPLSQYAAFPGTPLYNISVEMGLQSPDRFGDWADWLYTERDVTGQRLPWLNRQERHWIANLTYLGNLAYSGSEIISRMEKKPLNNLFDSVVKLFSRYFAWRLKRKSYRFVPELQPIIKLSHLYMGLLNRRG